MKLKIEIDLDHPDMKYAQLPEIRVNSSVLGVLLQDVRREIQQADTDRTLGLYSPKGGDQVGFYCVETDEK